MTSSIIIITSEKIAYDVLEKANNGELDSSTKIIFDGWPSLNLHMEGDKFNQSITPTVMKGLLEFQKGIYQSYASSYYGNATKRLKQEEKEDLEIKVDVNSGSSNFNINFQEIATKLIEQLGDKMEPTHVIATVISIAVLHFGTSAYKSYLQNRKEIREKEVSDETVRKSLEVIQFTSAEETKRAEIMADVIHKFKIETIEHIAHHSKNELLKSTTAGSASSIDGINLDPNITEILTHSGKRESKNVRFDGDFTILRIDWSDPERLKVKIKSIETGLEIDAEVLDDSLTGKYKKAIKNAEWSRRPVALKVNVKKIGEDTYKNAVILSANNAEITKKLD